MYRPLITWLYREEYGRDAFDENVNKSICKVAYVVHKKVRQTRKAVGFLVKYCYKADLFTFRGETKLYSLTN